MFIIRHRGKITIFLFALGVLTVVLIPNILGFVIGPIFIVMGLLLYTLPISGLQLQEGDNGRPDRVYDPVTRVMMGIGLGVMAALLVVFVPDQLFLPVMIVVLLAAVVYTFSQIQKSK